MNIVWLFILLLSPSKNVMMPPDSMVPYNEPLWTECLGAPKTNTYPRVAAHRQITNDTKKKEEKELRFLRKC